MYLKRYAQICNLSSQLHLSAKLGHFEVVPILEVKLTEDSRLFVCLHIN